MLAYSLAFTYGIIECSGRDASDFLQRMTTNDLAALGLGEAAGSALVTEKGRMVDFLTIARLGDTHWRLVTSPANDAAVYQWLRKYVIMEDVQLALLTNTFATMELWSDQNESPASIQHILAPIMDGGDAVRYERIPKRLEHGFNLSLLLVRTQEVEQTVQQLSAIGAISLSTEQRECIRIRSGIGQFPNEFNEQYTPLDAGLADSVRLGKGCFIGQEVLERLVVQNKVRWKLWSVECDAAAAKDLQNMPSIITTASGQVVGQITSLAPPCDYLGSSTEQSWIGLAYLSREVSHDTAIGTSSGMPLYLRHVVTIVS